MHGYARFSRQDSVSRRSANKPAMCRLGCQAQERLQGKRLGQVGQDVKLLQAMWAHTHSRKHYDGQFLGITIDLL